MTDPRVFFAAERTLLAWIRTGLTMIALGFVVSRFGLFLRYLADPSGAARGWGESPRVSGALGVLLVALGCAAIAAAARQHRAFVLRLPPGEVPERYRHSMAVAFAYAIALLGLALAVYLAL